MGKRLVFLLIIVFTVIHCKATFARVSGLCSNCHTMHNSQNGTAVTSYNGTFLLRKDCIGCHAQGGSESIVVIGNSRFPQVYHQGSEDLAGGNFAYITGLKTGKDGGSGDQYGHNVINIPRIDVDSITNSMAPGSFTNGHPGNVFEGKGLTCSGQHGCHGIRGGTSSIIEAIKGAHHNDVSGKTDGSDIPSSYRFLLNVKGFEVSDWKNSSPSHHNEYYGTKTPVYDLYDGCKCHTGSAGGYSMIPISVNGTIGGFCATCHPVFHNGKYTSNGTVSSPWLRHPSDYAIPNSGEYANFNNGTLTYTTQVPVARTNWPINDVSSTVSPGEDAVTCLSCHYSHAGPYPDMLRWDYTKCQTGESSPQECGCLVCHTSK